MRSTFNLKTKPKIDTYYFESHSNIFYDYNIFYLFDYLRYRGEDDDRMSVASRKMTAYAKTDCIGASKGLFFGLLTLVLGLICLILFFVLIDHENQQVSAAVVVKLYGVWISMGFFSDWEIFQPNQIVILSN